MKAVKTGDKVLHQQHGLGMVIDINDDKITVEFQSEPELERRLSSNNLMQRIAERNIQIRTVIRGTSVQLRVPIASMSPDIWQVQPESTDNSSMLSNIVMMGAYPSRIMHKEDLGWRADGRFADLAAPSVKKIVRESDDHSAQQTAQMLIEVSDLVVGKALDSHNTSSALRATSGMGARMTLTRCLDLLEKIENKQSFWYSSVPALAAGGNTYIECLNLLLLRCIAREVKSESDVYDVAREIEEVLESRFTSLFSLHLLSTAQALHSKVGEDFHHPHLSQITKLESRAS